MSRRTDRPALLTTIAILTAVVIAVLALSAITGCNRVNPTSPGDFADDSAGDEFPCTPGLPPKLVVRSTAFRTFVFRDEWWDPRYDIATPIFEGERLDFTWIGFAACCGLPAAGYDFAWDDTTGWCETFDLEETSLEITPSVGDHSLYVAAISEDGYITRGRVRVDVVEAPLDEYILVVDDWELWEGIPDRPTDAERDDFYATLTEGYTRDVLQWDVGLHGGAPPDVATMAGASTVIWYAEQDAMALTEVFEEFAGPAYPVLAGYARVGGNVILDGHELLRSIAGRQYPMTLAASDTLSGPAFVRDHLNIGSADYTGYQANKSAPWVYGYCLYGAVPSGTGVPGVQMVELEPMYIDSVGVGGWPEPGKWWLYTAEYLPNYTRCGLPAVESLETYQGAGIDAHAMDVYLNYTFDGQSCSMLSFTGSDRGNVCYFGFPLFYMQTDQALANFDRLLPLCGEQKR